MVNRNDAPQRLLLVVARSEQPGRYLFARWKDWPHPSLLAISPPHDAEGLDGAVESMLRNAFAVALQGAARAGAKRWPVRMAHPRFGGEGVGWLRPVAVQSSGDPAPGPPIDDLAILDATAALKALSTAVEREVFTAGVALLEG